MRALASNCRYAPCLESWLGVGLPASSIAVQCVPSSDLWSPPAGGVWNEVRIRSEAAAETVVVQRVPMFPPFVVALLSSPDRIPLKPRNRSVHTKADPFGELLPLHDVM